METETAEDFRKLKEEIRKYLQDKVQPMVSKNYKGYVDIYPVLYDIRHSLFILDRQGLINGYLKLRKKIESYKNQKEQE